MTYKGVPEHPFSITAVNLDSHVLNHQGRTVAIVTPQGHVDWLLAGVGERGPLLSSIRKETHLGYVLGLKFDLFLAKPCDVVESIECEVTGDGAAAVVSARSRSKDDVFRGSHRALISVNEETGAYEWSLETTLTCNADVPPPLNEIEYNDILPAGTGGRVLCADRKRYDRILIVDRNGVAWEFPHQHVMHYAPKTSALRCASGSVAGFFIDDLNPVVIVDESPFEPTWQICDAYYDLHCCSRTSESLEPGGEHVWKYRIVYMDRTQAEQLAGRARRVAVTDDDREAHAYPRVDIGLNTFSDTVHIDRPDEAGWFKPQPPELEWVRDGGPEGHGTLQIANTSQKESVWRLGGDTQLPPGCTLRVRGLAQTHAVKGKGFYLRARPFVFEWRPTPHIQWGTTRESIPVTGTTDGWVQVTLSDVIVPSEWPDCELAIEVVLDGAGTAMLSDLDLRLIPTT